MSKQDKFSPETVGRVVRWALMLFFAFVILQHVPKFSLGGPPVPTPPAPVKIAEKKNEKDCSGNAFNNFSLLAMPIFPVSSSTVAISDIKEGTGEPASCGQKANFRYLYARRGGDIIFSNMDSGEETKDVLIGGHEVIPGLERGLIDMKPGGERDISIPQDLGFAAIAHIDSLRDHDTFKFGGITGFMTARVALSSLTPHLPSTPLKLRILNEKLSNGEKTVECGDDIAIRLTLWKMDGTPLYSNENGEPLHFTVGKSQLPYGIEEGVIGMMTEGTRTLLLPPGYTSPLIKDASNQLLKDVAIPQDEILLATVRVEPPAAPVAAAPAAVPSQPIIPPTDKK